MVSSVDLSSSTSTSSNSRHKLLGGFIAPIIILVAIMAVYLPIVNHGFADWDDTKLIRAIWKPSWVRAWAVAKDVGSKLSGEVYYNPLSLLSLMMDQAMANPSTQPKAWIAKLTNIVLHAANTVLVFQLLLMIGVGRTSALFGALLFALHPLQVGTVAWITERKNLVSTFFYLSSMLCFLKYVKSDKLDYLWALIPLIILGLLAKPTTVTLPIALAAITFVVMPNMGHEHRWWISWLVLAVLFVGALGWGVFVLSTERTYSWILPSWPYRPLIAAGAIWFYLSKFFAPYGLAPLYPRWDVSAHVGWFAILLGAIVLVAALLLYYRNRLDRWLLFGAFFFLLNLGPVLGIIPFGYMSHSFVADHFMYLPMVGLAIVCARILDATYNAIDYQTTTGRLLTVVVFVWICALGVLSAMQTSVWRNPLTMWEAALKVNPDGYAALNNYALALSRQGDYEKAASVLQKAIKVSPKTAMGYDNLASIYVRTGRFSLAAELYHKSLQVNPRGELPYAMLARLKLQEGKNEEAIALLEKSVKELPRSVRLIYELGMMYAAAGRHGEAFAAYQKAVEIQPLFPDPYVKMGIILLDRGQVEPAIAQLKKALELSPRADVFNALGTAFALKGAFPKAVESYRKAIAINPRLPGVRDNLAHALIDAGKDQAAREFCRRSEAQGSPCDAKVLKRIKPR